MTAPWPCARRQPARAERSALRSGCLVLASALLLVLAPKLVLAAPLAAARAAEETSAEALRVEPAESDLLLLALKLDRTILAETLTTYSKQGRILVPLGEICRLLDLGITVDASHGLADGFFLRQDRLFHLDIVGRKVIVEGREKRFDPAGIELHADDLYVDTALFASWLPLHLEVDLYSSLITVRPDEKLPLQLRLERSAKIDPSQAGRTPAASHLPRFDLPYRLWDGPFIDQTLRLDRRPDSAGDGKNALQYSTYATADLLKMELGAFVAGTDQGIVDSRFSLGRKDPDGGLLGFLHAREATVGDVFHPGLDLIALPRSGPGLLVSNFPLQLPTQFDRQSFRGDLPPGWEVELYRSDELLAYAQARPDGLYEFLDVPLLFGLNVFRLEFYGPQGQRRREIQRLNVGESLTPKGEVYYRLAGNDPSQRLLGTAPLGSDRRGSLEVSAGLSRHLSASASVASVDLEDGRHTYGLGSLRGYWGWLFANASLAADRQGGSAWQGTLQTRLGAFGLLAQRSQLRRFESEALVSGLGGVGVPSESTALESRTLVRIDTALPESFLPRIPLLFEAREDQLADGRRLRLVSGRFSAFRRGLFVSNQVTWNFSSGNDPSNPSVAALPANAFGHFLISKYMQKAALRGEIDYNLRPGWEVTSALLTGERRFGHGLLLSAGLNRTFQREQTRYLLGLSRLEGAFGFGVTTDYSRDSGFGVSLLLSESIGRDPRTGDWHPQARALAGTGALSGLAFLDRNGNGRRDPGEEPIPGAGFLLNGGGNLARTDDAGIAFLANLQPYQNLDVALSPLTLEDPYWKPAQEGVKILPRPGKVARIDFPVQISGEITGTLFLRRAGVSRVAGNVGLELVDARGTIVQRVRSAYDGFYDLPEIRPGTYRLRVAPTEVSRLDLAAAPAREVEIAPSGTIVEGFNIYLTGALTGALTGTGGDSPETPRVEILEPVAERPERKTPAPPSVPARVEGRPLPSSAPLDSPEPPIAPGSTAALHPLPTFVTSDWRGADPIYAVQLASYRERLAAERQARSLAALLQAPVHVFVADLGSKGIWYRVLAGELRSPGEAVALRRDLLTRNLGDVGPAYRVEGRR